LRRHLRKHRPGECAISAIVAYELYFGAFKSQRSAQNLAKIDALSLQVLAFDREDGRHAGQIRAALSDGGKPIGAYDILIAGQARARNLVLVTANMAEFSRVDGLRAEDWRA